jgi:Ca-activated chloride channel family protein
MFEITAPAAPANEAAAHKTKSLIFVIDRSGSMSGGPLEMVKSTILDTLPRLNPEDYICVISFDDEVKVEVPIKPVKSQDMKWVTKQVSKLQAGGSTNIEAGYRAALVEATTLPRGIESSIILLSDGHANAGITDPAELGRMASKATEHFISTSTIGIGQSYDENLMGALADGGQGNHIAAIELAEAVNGLQAEIDGLLQKTMTDVKFTIALGPDFLGSKSDIIAGRRMKKWNKHFGRVETVLGDLASSQQKNVFFELVLDGHELSVPGIKQGIKVTYEYFDVLTGTTITKDETFEIELVAQENWVEPVRDPEILAEMKLVRIQEIQKRAFELYQQGREREADALLEAAGIDLREFMDNTDLGARSSRRMNSQADSLMGFSMMQDINIKRKRMNEYRSRSQRDQDDFRDKDNQ